jgi:hypothetical protein
MHARTVVLACCLSIVPAIAVAQSGPPVVNRSARATQSPPVRHDSKWNGALVGAGLGAVAGALIGSVVLECSECAGFNVPLTFGVAGAGAGAALGAGIDARLHQRSPILNLSRGTGRVNLSPVISRRITGVVASIRF